MVLVTSARTTAALLHALLLTLAVGACEGAHNQARRPTTPRVMPDEVPARHAAMDAFGERLFAALAAGRPLDVVLGDDELRALLDGPAATRVAAHRATLGVRVHGDATHLVRALSGSHYLGVCLQDARDEPAAGPLGLRSDGWTFRRVLVAAERPGGRRIALWVDGLFVFTDAGFGALDLERVESPRPEHSDLEIAPCDMATRLH